MYKVFILLFPCLILSAPLKILSTKLQSNVFKIEFNQNIKTSDFKKKYITDGLFYDVKAELTLKRQDIKMGGENYITIAQNSSSITRIVMETKNTDSISFRIDKNILNLSFSKAKNANSNVLLDSNKSKNVDSNTAVAKLFESIDIKSLNQNPPPQKSPKPIPNKISENTIPPKPQAKINEKKRIVVLDPGHGGKDCGAQVYKICEKSIVLDIAQKLKSTLTKRGYIVIMTRDRDKYISLTDRTKFANDKNADVFISIHANSLNNKSKNYNITNGIETYFLSPSKSERAKKIAESENKDEIEVMNYFSKLSFLNSINSQRMIASNKLAIDIQSGMLLSVRNMYSKVFDGGVREGPFWVLAGALMPSILIEVGYMTYKDELNRLQNTEYRQMLADGIANGIDSYFAKNF